MSPAIPDRHHLRRRLLGRIRTGAGVGAAPGDPARRAAGRGDRRQSASRGSRQDAGRQRMVPERRAARPRDVRHWRGRPVCGHRRGARRRGRRSSARVAAGRPSNADALIVVGTRGLGRAERIIFGSTTLRLMRTTTWPVLAVPHAPADHGHGPAAAPLAIDRLICGVDFSTASKAAARAAHTLGQALSVPVEIVHAVQMTARPAVCESILSPPEQEQIAAASSALDAVISSLGSPPALKAVRLGRPGRRPDGRRRGAAVAHRPRPWRCQRPSAGHDGHARHRWKPSAGPDRSARRVERFQPFSPATPA